MRRFFLLLLLCLLCLPSLAQTDFAMPDLPAEPIFSDERIADINLNRLVWRDDDFLIFAPYNALNFQSEDELNLVYSYQLSTNSLNLLEVSPFYANWSEEKREFFQTGDYDVHQPVFEHYSGLVPVIYQSNAFMACGTECLGTIIMAGVYVYVTGAPDPNYDSYMPLPMPAQTDLEVYWSRSLGGAVIEMGPNDAGFRSLFYVTHGPDMRYSQVYEIYLGYPFYSGRVLGISADGRYVLVESDETQRLETGSETQWETVPFLSIWTAPYHDDHCHCTHDAQIRRIDGALADNPNLQRNFAGFSFLDSDTLLFISTEGLFRYSLSTSEINLLNPEFNSYWIESAVFSPDNRYVAVTTAQGLYVLPTGID